MHGTEKPLAGAVIRYVFLIFIFLYNKYLCKHKGIKDPSLSSQPADVYSSLRRGKRSKENKRLRAGYRYLSGDIFNPLSLRMGCINRFFNSVNK